MRDYFGHQQCSLLCVAYEKRGISFGTRFKRILKKSFLWLFPARSHTSTNKNCHFLGLQKVTTFLWCPTIVSDNFEYFEQMKTFGTPLLDSPQTPGLYPPLVCCRAH